MAGLKKTGRFLIGLHQPKMVVLLDLIGFNDGLMVV
jgi:hypothetical protein